MGQGNPGSVREAVRNPDSVGFMASQEQVVGKMRKVT